MDILPSPNQFTPSIVFDAIAQQTVNTFQQLTDDINKISLQENKNEINQLNKVKDTLQEGEENKEIKQQARKEQKDEEELDRSLAELQKKEQQLREQLERVLEAEKQILQNKNRENRQDQQQGQLQKNNNPQQGQQPIAINPQQTQEHQQSEKIKQQKKKKLLRRKQKRTIVKEKEEITIIPREEFEKMVKGIAENIRSQVKKTSRESTEMREQSPKKMEYLVKRREKSGIRLPKISRTIILEDAPEKRQSELTSELILPVQTQSSKQFSLSPHRKPRKPLPSKTPPPPQISLKLDPVNHRYPVTSFRKKYLEQKQEKDNERRMGESLRLSALTKRRQMFESSRKSYNKSKAF